MSPPPQPAPAPRVEADHTTCEAEKKALSDKVNRLQALLLKAKEQHDLKAKLAQEKAIECDKMKKERDSALQSAAQAVKEKESAITAIKASCESKIAEEKESAKKLEEQKVAEITKECDIRVGDVMRACEIRVCAAQRDVEDIKRANDGKLSSMQKELDETKRTAENRLVSFQRELEDIKRIYDGKSIVLQKEVEELKKERDELKRSSEVKIMILQRDLDESKRECESKVNAAKEESDSRLRDAQRTHDAAIRDVKREVELRVMRSSIEVENNAAEIKRACDKRIAEMQVLIENEKQVNTLLSEEFKAYKARAHLAIQEQNNLMKIQADKDRETAQLQNEIAALRNEISLLNKKNSELGSLQQEYHTLVEKVHQQQAEISSLPTELTEVKSTYSDRENALIAQCNTAKQLAAKLESMFTVVSTNLEEYKKKYTELKQQLVLQSISPTLSPSPLQIPLTPILSTATQANPEVAPLSLATESVPPIEEGKPDITLSERTDQIQAEQHQMAQQSILHSKIESNRLSDMVRLKMTVKELEDELADMKRLLDLHIMQEKTLKDQIRQLDAQVGSSPANLEYIKNVVVKYMETHDYQNLCPVISSLLHFSAADIQRLSKIEAERSHKSGSLWNYYLQLNL